MWKTGSPWRPGRRASGASRPAKPNLSRTWRWRCSANLRSHQQVRARFWLAHARYCEMRGAAIDSLAAARRAHTLYRKSAMSPAIAFACLAVASSLSALSAARTAEFRDAALSAPYLEVALPFFRARGAKRAIISLLNSQALAGETPRIDLLEEVLALARGTDSWTQEAMALNNLGAAVGLARQCRARPRLSARGRRPDRAARGLNPLSARTHQSGGLGVGLRRPGDARRLVEASLEHVHSLPPGRILGEACVVLARLVEADDPVKASRLAGFAAQLFGETAASHIELCRI